MAKVLFLDFVLSCGHKCSTTGRDAAEVLRAFKDGERTWCWRDKSFQQIEGVFEDTLDYDVLREPQAVWN